MNLTTNIKENGLYKTNWGKRIEEVIFETDLSVRAFANLVGYKHPSTFYAAIKNRKISPKLKSKIIEGYRIKLKKELNPEWLINGNPPKLLTTINQSITPELVQEQKENYQYVCKKCIEKDEEILKITAKYNNLLEENNECLKELLALKNVASG